MTAGSCLLQRIATRHLAQKQNRVKVTADAHALAFRSERKQSWNKPSEQTSLEQAHEAPTMNKRMVIALLVAERWQAKINHQRQLVSEL